MVVVGKKERGVFENQLLTRIRMRDQTSFRETSSRLTNTFHFIQEYWSEQRVRCGSCASSSVENIKLELVAVDKNLEWSQRARPQTPIPTMVFHDKNRGDCVNVSLV